MSSDPIPVLPPRPRPKRTGMHPLAKGALWLTTAVFCLAAGLAGYFYYQFNHALDQVTSGAGTNSGTSVSQPADNAKPVEKKPTVFLLLGIDARAATGYSQNTDVIMVAAMNPKTKKAVVVSLPRDTLMHPAGHDPNKVNAFYSIVMREDKTGYTNDIKQIFGHYFQVPIDYLAVVNFNALKETVDQLGGVNVNVDMNMCYKDSSDGTDINLQKGPQHLNGTQALGFVRYRKANCGDGQPSNDFDRNRRQQEVVGAILEKLKTFGGATRALGLFNVISHNIKTDISKNQLEKLFRAYLGISGSDIEYIPVQGTWKSPYTYVDQKSLDHARAELNKIIGAS